MHEPIAYSQDHSNVAVDLRLTGDRLIARTQGKGMLDKPQTSDLPLSALKNFCLVPTIGAHHIIAGTGTNKTYDSSYDSEFIFSFNENGKLETRRIFVNSHDERFQRLLQLLSSGRPDASLLHLEPAEAQRQMGVISGKKALYVVIGLIVGVPIVIALIALASAILR